MPAARAWGRSQTPLDANLVPGAFHGVGKPTAGPTSSPAAIDRTPTEGKLEGAQELLQVSPEVLMDPTLWQAGELDRAMAEQKLVESGLTEEAAHGYVELVKKFTKGKMKQIERAIAMGQPPNTAP